MSAVEDLLLAHLRDVREKITAATASADALEALIEKLKDRAGAPLALPAAREMPDGWSAEEDAVLRQYYSEIGAAGCAKLLPHRTAMAIRVRASRYLKVTCMPRRQQVWCAQCESRVTLGFAVGCPSPFCKARDQVA